MLFVYLLALIGFLVLVVLSAAAIAASHSEADAGEPEDPLDEALAAVTRLQANAWTAIRQLRDLDRKE